MLSYKVRCSGDLVLYDDAYTMGMARLNYMECCFHVYIKATFDRTWRQHLSGITSQSVTCPGRPSIYIYMCVLVTKTSKSNELWLFNSVHCVDSRAICFSTTFVVLTRRKAINSATWYEGQVVTKILVFILCTLYFYGPYTQAIGHLFSAVCIVIRIKWIGRKKVLLSVSQTAHVI